MMTINNVTQMMMMNQRKTRNRKGRFLSLFFGKKCIATDIKYKLFLRKEAKSEQT